MRCRAAALLVAVAAASGAACGDGTGEGTSAVATPHPTVVEQRRITRPQGAADGGRDAALAGACRAAGGVVEVVAGDPDRDPLGAVGRDVAEGAAVRVRVVDPGPGGMGDHTGDVVELGLIALDEMRRTGRLVPADLDAAIGDVAMPAGLADASEGWVAPWVSAVAFLVAESASGAPSTFAELAADRSLTIGLAADPLRSEDALAAVVAAAVAAGGSTADVVPGIDWFAERAAEGRLVAAGADVLIGLSSTLRARAGAQSGAAAGDLVYPGDALVARPSVVGVVAGGSRPCALGWVRHLLSAEAARVAAAGGLLPARWSTADALRAVPAGQRAQLPAPDALGALRVLDAESAVLAREAVRDAWADRVGGAG